MSYFVCLFEQALKSIWTICMNLHGFNDTVWGLNHQVCHNQNFIIEIACSYCCTIVQSLASRNSNGPSFRLMDKIKSNFLHSKLLQSLPVVMNVRNVRGHSSVTSSWFWPFLTHPPYHQTSSFPIPTLMMTSSFPHTHPPIDIFFPLFNK